MSFELVKTYFLFSIVTKFTMISCNPPPKIRMHFKAILGECWSRPGENFTKSCTKVFEKFSRTFSYFLLSLQFLLGILMQST